MHNVPPDVDFESSRSPAKIGVMKQSQSALFGSVSHMAILFVFTCMMNVRDETRYSFVTQVCLLTIEYQVFQYVRSVSISEQSESILLAILPRISIVLL